jgi:hypothetical protein
MYTYADLQDEIDQRFEPAVRDTFDHYKGIPMPLFVLVANVNPTNGERYDKPTPCPVQLDTSGGPVTAHSILMGVKRTVLVTEAEASMLAYVWKHGVKIRAELKGETHEWLIPIITSAADKTHFFLGKRIDFAHGVGAHAKLLDDLDEFGGLFEKLGKVVEA